MVGTVPALGALAYKDKSRFTADLIVAKSGTRDYSNVYDAVDAGNEGDKIFVKKGTYEEMDIAVKDNMELVGVYGATILKLPNHADGDYGIIANADRTNGNEGFVIRNLVLDGNKVNNQGPPYFSANGINILKSIDVRIEHLIIKNSKQHGIFTTGISEKIRISKCNIHDNAQIGIMLHLDKKYCVIDQNHCYLNGHSGIKMGESVSTSKKNKILNNWCYNNSQSVVYGDGIMTDHVNETTIVGNICFDSQGTKTQRYGICVYATSDWCTVMFNDCRTNAHATSDLIVQQPNCILCNNQGRYTPQGCD
jgi:hypothetical protein